MRQSVSDAQTTFESSIRPSVADGALHAQPSFTHGSHDLVSCTDYISNASMDVLIHHQGRPSPHSSLLTGLAAPDHSHLQRMLEMFTAQWDGFVAKEKKVLMHLCNVLYFMRDPGKLMFPKFLGSSGSMYCTVTSSSCYSYCTMIALPAP